MKELDDSIRHWERIVSCIEYNDATSLLYEGIGPSSCSLCQNFLDEDCVGCPVSAATGQHCCRGTPYNTATKAIERWVLGGRDSIEALKAAESELAFLEGLREEMADVLRGRIEGRDTSERRGFSGEGR